MHSGFEGRFKAVAHARRLTGIRHPLCSSSFPRKPESTDATRGASARDFEASPLRSRRSGSKIGGRWQSRFRSLICESWKRPVTGIEAPNWKDLGP